MALIIDRTGCDLGSNSISSFLGIVLFLWSRGSICGTVQRVARWLMILSLVLIQVHHAVPHHHHPADHNHGAIILGHFDHACGADLPAGFLAAAHEVVGHDDEADDDKVRPGIVSIDALAMCLPLDSDGLVSADIEASAKFRPRGSHPFATGPPGSKSSRAPPASTIA